VIKCLKMLTFVPVEQIEEMEQHLEGAEFNKAKELLAYELTALVHGEEEAKKALETSKAVFSGAGVSENMPTTEIASDKWSNGIPVLDLLVETKLVPTKSEGRRLVQQGGISIDSQKITDPKAVIMIQNEIVIRKGKKVFHKVILK
ncbi:MAG: tyrosine--tRNA ligase, partial [Oscillospiraceae bacterium]|nr:tyrosine--tRNA ligase [Oscillospiraceae bacterium]